MNNVIFRDYSSDNNRTSKIYNRCIFISYWCNTSFYSGGAIQELGDKLGLNHIWGQIDARRQ